MTALCRMRQYLAWWENEARMNRGAHNNRMATEQVQFCKTRIAEQESIQVALVEWLTQSVGKTAGGLSQSKTEEAGVLPYQDPAHDGNSAQYHSGKSCRTKGCKEPAGTWWSPLWCFRHNVERMDNISSTLESMADKARFSELVNKACEDWRRTVGNLLNERNAILRAAGGKVTATKEQHRDSKHWSHQSHRDGSETYQIDL